MPPTPKDFLSNLEWHAISQGGRVREVLNQLQRDLAQARKERDDARADVARLTRENEELRQLRRSVPVAPRSPTPSAPVVETSAPKEEVTDDTRERFRLLELD